MSNPTWKRITLADICSFKYGKMPKKSERTESGYPMFSGYGIVGFADKYLYEQPEVIVVARGVGGTGDVKMSPPKCFLTNLSIAAQIKSPEVDKLFLFYRLQFPSLWELRTGSAQAQITIDHLERYETEIPPLPTQRKIASILSAYDDLIENNLRRIKILEEMAQALYREWFVNFRFPGHEKVRMVDSPLGKIPEGWGVRKVEDAFEITGGGTPSKKVAEYWEDGTINWYVPSDLTRAGTMFVDNSSAQITDLGLSKSSARMFPHHSVMLTSRATIGVVAINTTPACTNQGFITCMPNDRVPLFYLYHWVRSNTDTFLNLASGATFKEIIKRVFRRIDFLLPSLGTLRTFEDLVCPIGEQVLNLQRRSEKLQQTRDLLLPKLISGEVDVTGLEIETGERV